MFKDPLQASCEGESRTGVFSEEREQEKQAAAGLSIAMVLLFS